MDSIISFLFSGAAKEEEKEDYKLLKFVDPRDKEKKNNFWDPHDGCCRRKGRKGVSGLLKPALT